MADELQPWTCTLDLDGTTVTLAEDALSQAQWARIFWLANLALPHGEFDISPTHCPACRGAIATVCAEEARADGGAWVAEQAAAAIITAFAVRVPDEVT